MAGRQWLRLGVVGAGVVVGFPLLTSYALTTAPAGHGAVVVDLLSAATATMAVLRGHERPPLGFWVVAGAAAVAAMGFAWAQGGGLGRLRGGLGRLRWADLLLLGAVAAAAVGYAGGGLLARELGAWQTVSWALVLCSPLRLVLTVLAAVQQPPVGTVAQWAAFAYLGVVSMFIGFFACYRGLAVGPMVQVTQVQLVQPVLSLGWAGLLLGEQLTPPTLLGGLVVVLCAGAATRLRHDADTAAPRSLPHRGPPPECPTDPGPPVRARPVTGRVVLPAARGSSTGSDCSLPGSESR